MMKKAGLFHLRVMMVALTFGAFVMTSHQSQAARMELNTALGAIDVSIDNIISTGVQVRTAKRNNKYVGAQSGGTDYVRSLNNCPTISAGTGLGIGGTGCLTNISGVVGLDASNAPIILDNAYGYKDGDDKNFGGPYNSDDGRLNFDRGDITAFTTKILTDVEASMPTQFGEVTFFGRLQAYYDPVLRDTWGSYERQTPDDAARRELGRDLKVLDLSLSLDSTIPFGFSEIPYSLKIGKLAANNWGEATFSFTGISQGVVLDIPSARRAGAQIKEIIQTEYMIYGSFGLPFDIGVDAYYQLHHTPWNLSVSGSPFAISDTANPGTESAGVLWLTGASTSGTFRRNCNVISAAGPVSALTSVALAPNCNTSSNTQYTKPYSDFNDDEGIKAAEALRIKHGDLLLAPVSFVDADDMGQWGVQLSYYMPILTGIEFNFSYQNVHSRLPYARIRGNGAPIVTMSVIRADSVASSNSLNGLGCYGGSAANAGAGMGFLVTGSFVDQGLVLSQNTVTPGQRGYSDAGLTAEVTAGRAARVNNPGELRLNLDGAHFGTTSGIIVAPTSDAYDLEGYGYYAEGMEDLIALATLADATISGYWEALRLAEVAGDNRATVVAGLLALSNSYASTATATNIVGSLTANGANRYDVARINCAIFAASGGGTELAKKQGVDPALGFLSPIGQEYLNIQYNIRMEFFYPEDLKIIGMGFNTTIPWLEWGLQAELAWRPDTPLQQDVIEQIIAEASFQGVAAGSFGDTASFSLSPLVTTSGYDTVGANNYLWLFQDSPVFSRAFNPNAYASGEEYIQDGVIYADMLNITIGSTALYNGSYPVVNLLRADQGVLLLEANLITFLDDFPEGWNSDETFAFDAKGETLLCVNRGGTELPLGGVVGLDTRDDKGCSPDRTSMGYTIFMFLDYNNVLGTAWRVRPSLAVRHGVSGNTPTPIPGWREDSLSFNLGLGLTFQNKWNINLGWITYQDVGSDEFNGNSGLDTFSFDVSYSF